MTEMGPMELDSLLYGDNHLDYGEPAKTIPAGPDGGAELANWHLRRIVAIERQAELEDQIFKAEIAALRARRKERAAVHEAAAGWHKVPLRQWHRTERGAKRVAGKKLVLPGGHAQLRAAKDVQVTDEDALRAFVDSRFDVDPETGEKIDWAPLIFRQTEQFMVSELTSRAKVPTKKGGREPGSVADLMTADGEKVPGVRVVILPDSWTVSGS